MSKKTYSEADELRAWLIKAKEECKSAEEIIKNHNNVRIAMYESLVHEHVELDARQLRIDMRIRALGFTPPWEYSTNA
jgi:hypothetical protein